jgi:hypothetical protein
VSVTPKYLDFVQETTSTSTSPGITNTGENSNFTSTSEGTVSDIETKIYIVKTEGSTIHIQDIYGRDIEYDGTTSPNADWYKAIKAVEGSNYITYIDEKRAEAYVETSLAIGS